ncbi:hypothetical protein TNIN_114681 [Trichonephila inaurata madagascariensis]|uniref:Uncharacterized protein n=1 Tax=Trichonephila inaurata madagascariensis TaxID=2747483 RepID=A0A8X7C2B1_9ARAC|nr:hypothetical protein TNIN_114681 [Trichonephila inaurata madagascariensis]
MDNSIFWKSKTKALRAAFTVCCTGIEGENRNRNFKDNNEVNALYKQLQDKFPSALEMTSQRNISDFLLRSEELKKYISRVIFESRRIS